MEFYFVGAGRDGASLNACVGTGWPSIFIFQPFSYRMEVNNSMSVWAVMVPLIWVSLKVVISRARLARVLYSSLKLFSFRVYTYAWMESFPLAEKVMWEPAGHMPRSIM